MKLHARPWAFTALLGLGLAACDGGSSGTGITSAQGNVSSVATAQRAGPARRPATLLARVWRSLQWPAVANARAPFEDIRVTIEGTAIAVRTDPEGRFGLSGDFAGPVGIVFELSDGGSGRLVATVPRGGALTLTNVHIDGRSGQATVDDERVRFDGLIDGTDCDHDVATVVSGRSPADGNHYTVHFDTATVQDGSGVAVDCASLGPGSEIDVDGKVERDGEVEAESVEVRGKPEKSNTGTPGSGKPDAGAAGDVQGGKGSNNGGNSNDPVQNNG